MITHTHLSATYQMLVAAMTDAGLPVGGTASYPRLALDTMNGEELDKGGNICRVTGTLHSLSEDSLSEAFAMSSSACEALRNATGKEGEWHLVAVHTENAAAVNESIDTANTLYRVTVNINATIER